MATIPRSQNGWPVDPPRSSRTIPGTSVKVTVADGPAGDVLLAVLSQVDKRVEDIDLKSTRGEYDDWGYAKRNVRDGSDVSNHASATAVDVNATRHPLGKKGTFSAKQVAEIHKILAEFKNVVRWGGDYTGRVDEMHFEINAAFDKVKTVAETLNKKEVSELDKDQATQLHRVDAAVWEGGHDEKGTYPPIMHTLDNLTKAVNNLTKVVEDIQEKVGR